ncbi:putative manganese transporter [Irregularibacter muris]|uniref:Manganese transporter n=1 Tax=Irregularibacter muris TaxID=1796619 RepID=A0AAE3HDQ9_9FIRM|nr:putative manganese transporter [Irregularibacter muris]MCR1898557.1 putative manganese transporter [Irregularibacter muris]
MASEILQVIFDSAQSAFIEVTAFVGAVLIIFGYINFSQSGKLVKVIQESKSIQPIIGALLGLTPGCGGAIFVMPLFPAGVVSFGTVVATLIATMGDSAFVIMTIMPGKYILVSLFSFIAAIITGYIVDYFNFGDRLLKKIKLKNRKESEELHKNMDHSAQNLEGHPIVEGNTELVKHIGHHEGDEIDLILHHEIKGHQNPNTFGYKFTHQGYIAYWILIAIGLVFGILDLMQIELNELAIPHLGTMLGIIGILFSIFMMVMGKKFLQDDTHEEVEMKAMSLKETLIHNAQETAFVGTWVFVAYLVYNFMVLGLGGGSYAAGETLITGFLTSTGLLAVLIGTAIGIIPGCGPQIIFVTLYTQGMVPFAALLANAISQDGDALFPLLAIDKRSSFWATVFNTIPALIMGIIVYWLEIKFGLFA